MAIEHPTLGHRVQAHRDLVRVLLIFAAAAAAYVLILVAGTAWAQDPAPIYPFLADPAGTLPF